MNRTSLALSLAILLLAVAASQYLSDDEAVPEERASNEPQLPYEPQPYEPQLPYARVPDYLGPDSSFASSRVGSTPRPAMEYAQSQQLAQPAPQEPVDAVVPEPGAIQNRKPDFVQMGDKTGSTCSGRKDLKTGGVLEAKRTEYGTDADGKETQAICPGLKTNDKNAYGTCMTSVKFPGNYQFMESAATCDGCSYVYVPAVKCYRAPKDMLLGHWEKKDDPKCADVHLATWTLDTRPVTFETDVYKLVPSAAAYKNLKEVNVEADKGGFSKVMTVKGFKAFGSKLTKNRSQGLQYLFMCDLDHGRVIAINLKTKQVEMVLSDVVSPNDIAIWEKDDHSIDLYIGGGYGDSISGAAHTGVYSLPIMDKDGKWVRTKNNDKCDYPSEDMKKEQKEGRMPVGCSFPLMKRTLIESTSQMTAQTCAGIGLDFSKGKNERPVVWTAELDQFARLDGTNKVWGLTDASWHGDYQCTLPKESLSSKTFDLNYGLVDNIAWADRNTMVTAIYTDCNSPSATVCLGQDSTGGYMFNKNTGYQAVAFTVTCVNKYDAKSGKDMAPYSKTFVQSVANVENFSGRVTHIQPVGDDFVAVNYQASGVLIFRGGVKLARGFCYGTRKRSLKRNEKSLKRESAL